MVKRLRHHPFTVVSRVRIPVGSPLSKKIILREYIFDPQGNHRGHGGMFFGLTNVRLKDFKSYDLKPHRGQGYESR